MSHYAAAFSFKNLAALTLFAAYTTPPEISNVIAAVTAIDLYLPILEPRYKSVFNSGCSKASHLKLNQRAFENDLKMVLENYRHKKGRYCTPCLVHLEIKKCS